MVAERCIALALMTGGAEKLSAAEISKYAAVLGVTPRSIYRYMDKITRAKLLMTPEERDKLNITWKEHSHLPLER